MVEYTRRKVVSAAAGLVGLGSIAGCIEGTSGDPQSAGDGQNDATDAGGPVAQASFFVFGDLAAQVAGDAATADVLVPVGQHGHGWEPGPRVREDVREADLLVHGMEGFQPWVDDVLSDLEADGADVTAVDVSAEVSLFDAADHDGAEHHDHDTDHGEGHAENETRHEHDGDAPAGNETHHEHEDGHADTETHHEHEGNEGADDRGTDHRESGLEGEHDHGGTDPHFWMDPLRVTEAVGTVQEAFADADPDGAETYDANAADYRERLDGLHERIESTVDAAETEVVLVAGHDAFRYFEDRYDVQVEALTGLSPDDRPTPRDVEHAQEIIGEHGLEYVCADPLESQRAAEQLVAETDASEVLSLTAMPGLKEEWAEADWGYVEVMENVNLPTLERALDV